MVLSSVQKITYYTVIIPKIMPLTLANNNFFSFVFLQLVVVSEYLTAILES